MATALPNVGKGQKYGHLKRRLLFLRAPLPTLGSAVAIRPWLRRVLRLGDGRIVGTETPARKLTPAEISW